jgi:hypothetical protein
MQSSFDQYKAREKNFIGGVPETLKSIEDALRKAYENGYKDGQFDLTENAKALVSASKNKKPLPEETK